MNTYYGKDLVKVVTLTVSVAVFEDHPASLSVNKTIEVPNAAKTETEVSGTNGLSMQNAGQIQDWITSELASAVLLKI